MTKINFSYFIKLLINIINNEKLNFIKSELLIFTFTFLVYHGFSIYNYKFKPIDEYFIKFRYPWLKTFFFNNKFYDNYIIFLSIEILQLINNKLNLNYINNDIQNILFDINLDLEYIEFNKLHFEIIQNTKLLFENYFNTLNFEILFKLDNDELLYKIYDNVEINNYDNILLKLYLKKNKFNDINKYVFEQYNNINKTNELIEILTISKNISFEQKQITKFWIKIINKIGIIGLWNIILYSCYKYDTNNQYIQLEIYFKFNFYLFQSIIYLCWIKKKNNNVSPYEILKKNILDFNNNSLWFIDEKIKINYLPINDYPSEIHLLSSLASNLLSSYSGTNTNISNFSIEEIELLINNYNLGNINYNTINLSYIPILSDNDINENNSPIILGFKDWNSISESIEISHIFMIQSFITSNHIGKEIAFFLLDTDNYTEL